MSRKTKDHQKKSDRLVRFIRRLSDAHGSRAQIAHQMSTVSSATLDSWIARRSLPRNPEVYEELSTLAGESPVRLQEYLNAPDDAKLEDYFPALTRPKVRAIAAVVGGSAARSQSLAMPTHFYESADPNPDRDRVIEMLKALSPDDRFYVLAKLMAGSGEFEQKAIDLAEPPNQSFAKWIDSYIGDRGLNREILTMQVEAVLTSGEQDVMDNLDDWIDGKSLPTIRDLNILSRTLRDEKGLPIPFNTLVEIAYPKT